MRNVEAPACDAGAPRKAHWRVAWRWVRDVRRFARTRIRAAPRDAPRLRPLACRDARRRDYRGPARDASAGFRAFGGGVGGSARAATASRRDPRSLPRPSARSRAPLARAASADAEPRASEPGASPGGDGGSPEADDDHDDHAGDIEIPEKPKHVRVVDGFLPPDPSAPGSALGLRAVFDAHHDDPRRTHAYRFVWDYWHVPNQYTLLRTPAADYFPERDFAALERRLAEFARDELGCAGVTPVWLSCYVEGMRQELHADVPHGPWAFVLSLTRWDERTWTGGETLILKPSTLDYWSSFDADATVERGRSSSSFRRDSTGSRCSTRGRRTACRWWGACATRARAGSCWLVR